MARAEKPTGPKPVDSLRHQDSALTIPQQLAALTFSLDGEESCCPPRQCSTHWRTRR